MESEKSQRLDKILGYGLLLLIVLTSFILGLHYIDDWDFGFHIKTGAKILESGVPRLDPYSFRTEGREWLDAQWLFQVIIYLAYRVAGIAGLSVFIGLLTALIWVVFSLPAWKARMIPIVLPIGILALWASAHRIYLRPELLTYLLTGIYLLILEHDRIRRGRLIFIIPLLQIFWANIHGLWPIGIFIIGAYFCEELILKLPKLVSQTRGPGTGDFSPRPGRMFALLAASLAVCLVNPYFYKGFLFPLTLLPETIHGSNYIKTHIEEELPPFPLFRFPLIETPFVVIAIVSLVVLILNRKKPRPAQWLLFLAFLALGLNARRNMAFLCLYSLPLIAQNLSAWFSRNSRPAGLQPLKMGAAILGISLASFLDVSVVTGKFFSWDKSNRKFGAGLDYSKFPYGPAEFLKQIKWKGNIFNQLHQGGFLIAVRDQDWKIYVDGRTEL